MLVFPKCFSLSVFLIAVHSKSKVNYTSDYIPVDLILFNVTAKSD